MKTFFLFIHSFVKHSLILLFLPLSLISFPVFAGNGLNAFVPPDQVGSYRIGIIETTAVLYNGRVTPIRIWYPTLDQGATGSYVYFKPPGLPQTSAVNILSMFGGINNASVAKGTFPLIIENHPSVAGNQSAALSQYPTNELLASHGFIVADYLRGDTPKCTGTVYDPRMLIDFMLNASNGIGGSTINGVNFSHRIDANKIGASGLSGGGKATLSLVSGISGNLTLVPVVPAIPGDPRVKALVLGEPASNSGQDATCGLNAPQLAAIKTPYLLIEGSPIIGPTESVLFNGTTSAFPRFDIHVPNLVHLGMSTGTCSMVDQEREASLARQSASNPNQPLQDPFFIPVSSALDGGVGADSWATWNLNAVIPAAAGIGGAREYCNTAGVNSAYLSLNNGQGFTTIPPYGCTGPTSNVCTTYGQPTNLTEEQINHIMYLYSVSFWKVFLAGDIRYAPYLTPLYAHYFEPNVGAVTVNLW